MRYIERMAPEGSVSFGAAVSSPALSDVACCGEPMVEVGASGSAQAEIAKYSVHHAVSKTSYPFRYCA